MPVVSDPNLIVGIGTADDAAVYRITDDKAIVQTVDFFTPVVDDPYTFGLITAANALSDIYAMGARPLFALNIVAFPSKTLPMDVLYEILRGGADKAREAGIGIVGGHSIDDPEPKYGMVVTGIVHPDRVVANSTARVGDVLVLTKPLGIGIITTAIKREKASKAAIERAVSVMSALNREASEAMVEVDVSAGTDITGFGLLGHLLEMVQGSGVCARIYLDRVPVIEEAWGYAGEGIVPGGSRANLEYVNPHVQWGKVSEDARLVLSDAQTSGGLLISVPKEKEGLLLSALRVRGVNGVVIGEILEGKGIEVVG
jgi:selenide,water dikinase